MNFLKLLHAGFKLILILFPWFSINYAHFVWYSWLVVKVFKLVQVSTSSLNLFKSMFGEWTVTFTTFTNHTRSQIHKHCYKPIHNPCHRKWAPKYDIQYHLITYIAKANATHHAIWLIVFLFDCLVYIIDHSADERSSIPTNTRSIRKWSSINISRNWQMQEIMWIAP